MASWRRSFQMKPSVKTLGCDSVERTKHFRVNTIDTRADGVTPSTREANNAARIRSQRPDDTVILVPKPK